MVQRPGHYDGMSKKKKKLEAFEMCVCRRMERVKWTDKIKNAAVLERVGEGRIMLELINKRKINWLGHGLGRTWLLKDALEGMGKREEGSRQKKISDDREHYDKWTIYR